MGFREHFGVFFFWSDGRSQFRGLQQAEIGIFQSICQGFLTRMSKFAKVVVKQWQCYLLFVLRGRKTQKVLQKKIKAGFRITGKVLY